MVFLHSPSLAGLTFSALLLPLVLAQATPSANETILHSRSYGDANGDWQALDSYGIMMPREDEPWDSTRVARFLSSNEDDNDEGDDADEGDSLIALFKRHFLPSALSTRTSRDIFKRGATVHFEGRNLVYKVEDEHLQKREDSHLVRRKSKKHGRTSRRNSGKGVKNNKKGNALGAAISRIGTDIMKGDIIKTTITWYTGKDLLNPFCDRKSHWTPSDSSLVVAVTEVWANRPACGEFLELTTPGGLASGRKSVIARVVDLCGGCKPHVPHADLSKAAFQKLYGLDVGEVSGLLMRKVAAPKGKWSTGLYGPQAL